MRRGRWALAGVVALVVTGLLGFTVLFSPAPHIEDTITGCPTTAPTAGPAPANSADQRANATIIANVGAQMGVSQAGQVIAIATAMQESGLRNLDHGDRDSIGLFQQRPSQGWGTVAQIMDPTYAATKFYTALLKVPGWESMDPGLAAQSVQRSAFPSLYAGHIGPATALLASLGSNVQPVKGNSAAGVNPCSDSGPIVVNIGAGQGSFHDGPPQAFPRANPRSIPDAIAWAKTEAASGHSGWYRRCLAFTAITYGWQFSGVGYAIDHYTAVPPEFRHPGDRNPMPGALLYWDTGSRAGHIAVYLGAGMLASNDIQVDGQISVVPVDRIEQNWGARYVGWTPPYFPYGG